jgi:gingipain R
MRTDLYDLAAIGSTPQEIRDFIAAQYHAGDGLAFVQLVGDADRVPTFLTDVIFWDIHGCSDSSYGLLDGTDTYPEVIVGRFSAETEQQVETQVERTIWYERDIAGGHWLHRAAGLGTVWGEGYGYNGWSGVQSLAVIRSDLLAHGYTEVAELYEEGVPPFSIIPVEAWEVTEVLEDGIGLLNVDGNADTTYLDTGSYTIGDIDALENEYALPFVFLAAPWCGNFVKHCFAEEWLRARSATTGAPTGAVAVYTWSNALEYAPPQAAMHEMVDLLTAEAMHTFGGLVVNGACFMMDLYGAPDAYDTFRNSNILGDASLVVRTTYPDPIVVTHGPAMLVGETEFQVSTSREGALVCLSEDGAIIAVGSTDPAGDINLTFDPLPAPTTLTLTVTAFNGVTAVHTVPVLPGTGAPEDGTPRATAIRAVLPNPTRGGSRVEYSLARGGRVVVEVFSVAGRRVRAVVDRREVAGTRSAIWDGKDDAGAPVASGVYLVRLTAGDVSAIRKIAVIR